MRRNTGQVRHEVIESRYVQPGKRSLGHHLKGHRHVLRVLRAKVGGNDYFLQWLVNGKLCTRLGRRANGRGQDANTARREVLEGEVGALEHSGE